MTLDYCIQILSEHNKWRRGEGNYGDPDAMIYHPATIGQAIDFAIEQLHRLKGLEK